MISNYFKTLIRSLWKNKGYSFLNVFGLAIGITCAALIFLWVEDEVSFDSFNVKKDRLYILKVNNDFEDYIATFMSTPGPLGPAMRADFPGVANTCRYTETPAIALFDIGDRSVYADGRYAEPSFFDMFTLPFEQGNAKTAFSKLHSMVITHRTAIKFFGSDKDVIGKIVRMDKHHDYEITGILKDLPSNSTLQFEWISPFQVWADANQFVTSWGNFSMNTFVELKPGIDPASINNQLKDYIQHKTGDARSTAHPFLFAMNKWNLYDQFENGKETGGGRIQYVHLFSIIAWIILLIACINFMNLSTARSEQRSREVGVRKVLGANKKALIGQFIGEAILMSVIATILAVLFMLITLSSFNLLVEKNLSLGLNNPLHILALLIIALICGIIAGSYPALYLSSFNPVFVLKGLKIKTVSATLIRRGLVVGQFAISIILIISTLIIYKQIRHVKGRNLGLNKDNLIQMRIQGNMVQNFNVIKHDLLNTGEVENAALSDYEPLYSGNNTSGMRWEGKDPNSSILVSQRLISPEFVSVSRMHIIEGRDFEQGDIIDISHFIDSSKANITQNVIITASMRKLLGNGSALGKIIQMDQRNGGVLNERVVGVIDDYVYGDMYGKPDPVVFYCIPEVAAFMYVRLKSSNHTDKSIAAIQAVMNKDNPGYPFEFTFTDERFNQLFKSETLVSKLSQVFAVLAIIISCLGLFGLAAYTAERRTKEIGIRKVLGASVSGVTQLLTKDFLKLVCLACIVAFPIAWWMMHNWLQNYQYRINIDAWVFVIAGLSAIVIAVLTVSFQAIKAAIANPVRSLRTE